MASASSLRFVVGALAAWGLLAGCGRTVAQPATLVDLKDRTLKFTLTDVDSLERDSTVGAHRFTLVFSEGLTCARLADGVTATLNGQPMKLEPGGVPDTGVGGREVCESPRATFDFDPERWDNEPTEDLRIILQDDTHSMVLVLRDAKAKRRFLRESGSPGTLRRNQAYSYAWLPETDVLQGPTKASLIHKNTGALGVLDVQQEGNTSRFTVPPETVEGQFILRMSGTAVAQVLTCEGVARCEGGLYHSGDVDVTVSP
ncbi:hypothetical protein [Archangium violaceum]|uniref:Uncharacterized protein n=1 Tax=Archangium violaceum Cb vi76 TaxID=1406225 RepID=A0A084SM78_9BACT|nr:hypothetical protein [Archangium violaceum]KFA89563.1 hypothetical protein Q664_34080 [Archangium violaceum Cb vi76]